MSAVDPVGLLAAVLLAASALSHPGERLAAVARTMMHEGRALPEPDAIRFEAAARRVSNWRDEAADALEPQPLAAFAALVDAGQPVVTRCVKLNNYWCLKSARWTGELGTDAEGHVGFASAERGADAAASLLRRYYLDLGRRSASDIVRRWAPAECGDGATSFIAGLAVRGIGGTLRARWLAARSSRGRVVKLTAEAPRGGKGRAAGAPPPRVSVVIPRALPTVRIPDIAVGTGAPPMPQPAARPVAAAPARTAQQPLPTPVRTAASKPAPDAVTATAAVAPDAAKLACVPDEQRLRNYAARIADSVGLRPDQDLDLFLSNGTPGANLAPVLLAMSGVELGLLRAREALVAAAIERLRERLREDGGSP